jgi:ABC-type bacteriocin/lantibiotic exporter with double-glycine peptidase domain
MYEDASQVATDAVGSIRTIASFCAEKRVVKTYNNKCEALRKQGIRSGIVGGLGFGFSFLVLYLTYALCFYVGAQFVRQGKTTFADVFRVSIPRSFQVTICLWLLSFNNHDIHWMFSGFLCFSFGSCWGFAGKCISI